MLGLLYGVFTAFCYGFKGLRDYSYNIQQKAKNPYSEEWNYPMYLDSYGRWRDTNTDEILYKGIRDIHGEQHLCIWSIKTQQIKKDITAEENKAQRKNALLQSKSVYRVSDGTYVDPDILGHRFQDIQTNEIYVKRRLKAILHAYMRVDDGIFVRPVDETPKERWQEAELLVERFNKEQKRLTELTGKMFPFNKLRAD